MSTHSLTAQIVYYENRCQACTTEIERLEQQRQSLISFQISVLHALASYSHIRENQLVHLYCALPTKIVNTMNTYNAEITYKKEALQDYTHKLALLRAEERRLYVS